MNQEPEPISPLLDSLSCELIGMCLDMLAEGEELWPTLMYAPAGEEPGEDGIPTPNPADDSGMACVSFDDDTLEGCLDAARQQVSKLPASVTAYAIAYTGFIQMDEDGATQDALLVEFGERGMRTAFSAYVPYNMGQTETEFSYGEPLAAGEEPLLFQ